MAGKLLAAIRMLLFALITIVTLLLIAIVSAFPGRDKERVALEGRRRWTYIICRLLGIQVESQGWEEQPVYVLISNHRSYIDPVITLREARTYPVAKAEVSRWPLIGWGARFTGIIFVKRESRESRRTAIQAIEEALDQQLSVLIYPEGTTTGDPGTQPFKMGAFRVAARKGVPVIPCAIDYPNPRNYWTGDDTFVRHFFETFSRLRTQAVVRYGPPIYGDDPRVLMQETKQWIDNQL
jgi:1-acyl-sn-glycerol-3-phosphate acyltransferase